MNKYHDIEVIINNKRYTLSGYEGEEYLQKIASYINNKHNEFRNTDAYKFLDHDLKNILIQINIADEYYKAKERVRELEEEKDNKSNEIYEIKHEVITAQTKLNLAHKDIEELKKQLNEAHLSIARLEAERTERKEG